MSTFHNEHALVVDAGRAVRYDPAMAAAGKISAEITHKIRRFLKQEVGHYALCSVEMKVGEDHDGDPVLFIDAWYDLSPTRVDTKQVVRTSARLHDLARGMKLTIFPYLRHHFDEAQKIVGDR